MIDSDAAMDFPVDDGSPTPLHAQFHLKRAMRPSDGFRAIVACARGPVLDWQVHCDRTMPEFRQLRFETCPTPRTVPRTMYQDEGAHARRSYEDRGTQSS